MRFTDRLGLDTNDFWPPVPPGFLPFPPNTGYGNLDFIPQTWDDITNTSAYQFFDNYNTACSFSGNPNPIQGPVGEAWDSAGNWSSTFDWILSWAQGVPW
jgi:hypothetical protein